MSVRCLHGRLPSRGCALCAGQRLVRNGSTFRMSVVLMAPRYICVVSVGKIRNAMAVSRS